MGTYAKIVKDSISASGDRLTTFEICFHRFVLAEFNTHRVLSKNSASSRAIPVHKQLAKIKNDPAVPLVFPAEKKGMQGGESLTGAAALNAETEWLAAADFAIEQAEALVKLGVHKSVVNRILEPFMWHTVIVTGTAWENFFNQRNAMQAQPEIRAVAELMHDAYYGAADPMPVEDGSLHLPYIDAEDVVAAQDCDLTRQGKPLTVVLARISAARCARVSYLTQDGKRDISEDLNLFKRLVEPEYGGPPHWSPLEHVATPWSGNRQSVGSVAFRGLHGTPEGMTTDHLPRVGNLLGWRSLRTEYEARKHIKTYV